MRTWLFDLGNSRLKCAPLRDDGRVGDAIGVAHDGVGLVGDLDGLLPARIDVAYVASVASTAVRVALLDALAARCGRIVLASTQPRSAGVTIAYAQPPRLGVDRFLTLLAAHAHCDGNKNSSGRLIVGVGTALTIDLIDGDGLHRGGRIAPSPQLMRAALQARAAQLPIAGGEYVEFASDTTDALASGCDGAAIALVERSLHHATALLGTAPRLLLHGGGRAALAAQLPQAIDAPTLVLDGLAVWAQAE
ncbi:MAG: type III pantothenate kinase [Luteimonas sp.]